MTPPARFVFDECLSILSMRELEGLVPDKPEFAHVIEKYHRGIPDSDWIPQLAAEERWVVVTTDRGKKSTAADKLPRLCSEFKITHVLLSAAIHARKTDEKRDLILSVWDRLVRLNEVPPGTRFKLRFKAVKKGLRLVLERVDVVPPKT